MKSVHPSPISKKHVYPINVVLAGMTLCVFTLVGLLGPFFHPSISTGNLEYRLASPSFQHPLGCDLYGRDVLMGMIYGSRRSLSIAFLTVLISACLGCFLGMTAGYFQRWWDTVVMRLCDLAMAFPGILVAMTVSSLLGASFSSMVLAMTLTGWAGFARILRGQTLAAKRSDHVVAARTLGANDIRILVHHIFPEIAMTLMTFATFSLGGVIITEASLSFLGLGDAEQSFSWGEMLNQGRQALLIAPHLSLIPGSAIMALVLSCNVLGNYLRE